MAGRLACDPFLIVGVKPWLVNCGPLGRNCGGRSRRRLGSAPLRQAIGMLYLRSMTRFFHHVFLILIGFAMVGGTAVQLARSAMMQPPSVMADMPCDMAEMPMADAGSATPIVPCKGLTPDCIKQMGCIVAIAIPVRLVAFDMNVSSAAILYLQTQAILFGTDRTPDLMPPRTT